MFFDDCLREKETQADALAFGGEKGFEDMFDYLRVDALAGVGKSHKKFAVVADEADTEAAAVGHRLSRIGDDVNEAQAQLFGVYVEHRRYVAALLDDLDALAFELRFGERQYAVHDLAEVGRRRADLDRLSVMQERLDHLGEAANLVLHDGELAQKLVTFARELRSVARAELVEGQADEVERILDFMRERAGELSEGGKAFEPVELELTLAGPAKLRVRRPISSCRLASGIGSRPRAAMFCAASATARIGFT